MSLCNVFIGPNICLFIRSFVTILLVPIELSGTVVINLAAQKPIQLLVYLGEIRGIMLLICLVSRHFVALAFENG